MPKKKNKGGGGGGGGNSGAAAQAAAQAAAEIISAGAKIEATSSGFRFQDGVVEDDIMKDMKSLKALSEKQLNDLVSMSLEFLTSTDASILVERAQEFAEEHEINIGALKTTLRSVLIFFKGAARKHLSKALLQEDLVLFGLAHLQAAEVAKRWHMHLESLSSSIADHALKVNKLVDIDWRFGVSSSSSELQQVGRTYLQLRLQLDKGGGHTQTSCMELTLPQFYEFLQEMEKAKASMDFLS
mmetsp:Transcript_2506/g.3993  ORF Transcript_2506/g.3993 Transcript_2506/m.3993 type:complete len:242 (+) Transcript_2506:21-746(+)